MAPPPSKVLTQETNLHRVMFKLFPVALYVVRITGLFAALNMCIGELRKLENVLESPENFEFENIKFDEKRENFDLMIDN